MPRKAIIFVTGNKYKLEIAKQALGKNSLKIKIIQKRLGVPEIQDESVEKVAAFSARWASNVLKRPVVVSDGGCYIKTLGGFPGPFIKYINQWLSVKDLLRLMDGKKSRRVLWKDCLAYCESNGQPVTFVSCFDGTLAKKIGKNKYRKKYGWIDTLFIPQKFKKPLSELPTRNYLEFWSGHKKYSNWQRLLDYLKSDELKKICRQKLRQNF